MNDTRLAHTASTILTFLEIFAYVASKLYLEYAYL